MERSVVTVSTPAVAPVPREFVDGLCEAVAQNDALDGYVGEVVSRGLRNVYLVGRGGSFIATHAVQFLLEHHSTRFPVFHLNADEFTYRRPPLLGEGSLVVTLSHRGSTPETVAATRLARDRGADVLALTTDGDSPLARAADRTFLHRTVDGKHVLLAQVGWALLRHTGVRADYDGIRAGYAALPDALLDAWQSADERLHGIARQLADEPVTYVVAGGPNYGAGLTLAMCYLQEMQWLDAAAVHADEFFHGLFEVVTAETAVLLMLGEDETRPMAERVRRFLDRYTRKGIYLDSRDFALPGVPRQLRGFFTPALFYSLNGRLAEHYAAVRGHPLDDRRYMWKVDY